MRGDLEINFASMNEGDKIPGGYYLKARSIQSSTVSTFPPHVREIWDWLLMNANHTDNAICKRGELVRTYEDIQDGLKWYIGWRKMTYSKWDCEKAMKVLKRATMITTEKTTRGMLIRIVNYDRFQNPSNYEISYDYHTKATRKPQTCHTINKNDKNNTDTYGQKVLETFNQVRGTNFRVLPEKNLSYWLSVYSVEDVLAAIRNISSDEFWKDKMTPAILFRRKNPRGEEVDYIGQLLHVKKQGTLPTGYKLFQAKHAQTQPDSSTN